MIVVVLTVVSMALLGVDVINYSSTDDGGNQLIGADPEWIEDRIA